jgi:hypothetical protein
MKKRIYVERKFDIKHMPVPGVYPVRMQGGPLVIAVYDACLDRADQFNSDLLWDIRAGMIRL